MPNNKVNSLDGVRKKHSIIRTLIPLLEGLLKSTPVNEVGVGRIVRTNFKPIEPIEVRGFNIVSNRHNIQIRAYGQTAYQNLFLYCHKESFPEVMEYILRYCERGAR